MNIIKDSKIYFCELDIFKDNLKKMSKLGAVILLFVITAAVSAVWIWSGYWYKGYAAGKYGIAVDTGELVISWNRHPYMKKGWHEQRLDPSLSGWPLPWRPARPIEWLHEVKWDMGVASSIQDVVGIYKEIHISLWFVAAVLWICLGILLWRNRKSKSVNKRICRYCSYSLIGIDRISVCPECGKMLK